MDKVVSIEQFKRKYGRVGFNLVLSEFIKRAPEFPGDNLLIQNLNVMMADLESALKNVPI